MIRYRRSPPHHTSGVKIVEVIPWRDSGGMQVTISVPDPILDAVERLAKQRHVSRSQLFAEAVQEYVSRHGSEAVTAKLNEVYGAEELVV